MLRSSAFCLIVLHGCCLHTEGKALHQKEGDHSLYCGGLEVRLQELCGVPVV